MKLSKILVLLLVGALLVGTTLEKDKIPTDEELEDELDPVDEEELEEDNDALDADGLTPEQAAAMS